jgi:hypothetical protein
LLLISQSSEAETDSSAQVEWKFVRRNPANVAMPPQLAKRSPEKWMRFLSKATGEEYFVNERTGESKKTLPAGAVVSSIGQPPEPEPEPSSLLNASVEEDIWDIDVSDDGRGKAEAPPSMLHAPDSAATATGSRPSRAMLSRQKGSGAEYAASRKDLPLDAANVRRCVVAIHERTIELALHNDSGALLLKAVDEADCASWGRCLHEVGRLQTEWRQAADVSSIL